MKILFRLYRFDPDWKSDRPLLVQRIAGRKNLPRSCTPPRQSRAPGAGLQVQRLLVPLYMCPTQACTTWRWSIRVVLSARSHKCRRATTHFSTTHPPPPHRALSLQRPRRPRALSQPSQGAPQGGPPWCCSAPACSLRSLSATPFRLSHRHNPISSVSSQTSF